MNQEGGGTSVIDEIPAAVSSGALNASLVDDSFARLMEVRIRLGMLDPPTMVPYNYIGVNASEADTAAHIALSRLVRPSPVWLSCRRLAAVPSFAAVPTSNARFHGRQRHHAILTLGLFEFHLTPPLVRNRGRRRKRRRACMSTTTRSSRLTPPRPSTSR